MIHRDALALWLLAALLTATPAAAQDRDRLPAKAGDTVTAVPKDGGQAQATVVGPIRARWQDPDRSGIIGQYRYDRDSRPVLGLKYAARGTARLRLDSDRADLSSAVRCVELHNLHGEADRSGGRGRSVVYSLNGAKCTNAVGRAGVRHEPGSATFIVFDVDELLGHIWSPSTLGVNRNVFEVSIDVAVGGTTRAVRGENLLHLVRQKLLVFLPGVFGSTIHLKYDERNEEEVYPRMSLGIIPESLPGGTQYLKQLEFGADGKPCQRCEATRLDLFRSYGVDQGGTVDTVPVFSQFARLLVPDTLVYDVERRRAVTEPKLHPRLRDRESGAPLQHYVVQPWPYDWRGRLQEQVAILLQDGKEGGALDPPYPKPPSLAWLVERKKVPYPFLDDKVALIGHSTGGLIVRGALVESGIEQHVDHAFFIDVPFYGAPKAYFVYLTGVMGIPFLGADQMRVLAPDMPIVYYLAPTKDYPDPVAKLNGREPRWRRVTSAGEVMKALVAEARRHNIYPRRSREWNERLDQDASVYHSRIRNFAPRIGWDRCLVFFSRTSAETTATIGTVYVTPNGFASDAVPGDGTVPVKSQIGDFADKATTKVEISSSPAHAAAPNVDMVWEKIVDVVSGRSP